MMWTPHWVDYLVPSLVLGASALIGLYCALRYRTARDCEEYLAAGRRMPVIPVTCSVFTSWLSATLLFGDVVVIHEYGLGYVFLAFGYVLGVVIATAVGGKFHKLQLLSIFEYIEIRFSRRFRQFCSTLLVIQLMLLCGAGMYLPALFISKVSSFPVYYCITVVGLICIVYTVMGGLRAVIWSNSLQFVVLLAGLVAVITQGSLTMGGFDHIRQRAQLAQINVTHLLVEGSVFLRPSSWTLFFGGIGRVFCAFVSNQLLVQQVNTVTTTCRARVSVFLTLLPLLVVCGLLGMTALTVQAMWPDCQSHLEGADESRIQLIPYLLLDIVKDIPGLQGLVLAMVMAAATSTFSAGLCTLSALTLSDFARPHYKHRTEEPMSSGTSLRVAVLLATCCGLLTLGVSYVPLALGSYTWVLVSVTEGVIIGPSAGLFIIAFTLPRIRPLFVYLAYGVSLTIVVVVAIVRAVFSQGSLWADDQPHHCMGVPDVTNTSMVANVTSYLAHTIDTSTEVPTGNSTESSYTESAVLRVEPLLNYLLGCILVLIIASLLHACTYCKDVMSIRQERYKSPAKVQYEVITKIQGERDVFPYNDFPSDTLRRSQGTLRRPPNYDPRAEVPTEWGDRRSVRVSVASLKDLKARGAARLSRHSQVLDGESTEMLLMDMEEQPQEQGGNKQKEETEAVENTNPWSMRR